MARERLTMRKAKEVLRLTYGFGLSQRQVARTCGVARSSVADYLARAERAGIKWPLPDGMSEQELENKLFLSASESPGKRALPDCAYIQQELRRHKKYNLTLDLLWQEYKQVHPDGYQYSQFCVYYRRWRKKLDYCMRQDHVWGEKLFVDYGEGLNLVDPKTGEPVKTQLFVAVWGASNYTYAEATLTQQLPDWIGSHIRAFEYFGCVPQAVVPDCLKSAVTRACLYEPDINPTYADLAEHYNVAVFPARPRKPKDKAKVETGVLIAKRWILAVLRHRTFYTLKELNQAMSELLEQLNSRLLRKMKKSRRELFESFERPQSGSLPQTPYEYADWKNPTVNIDYHIEVDHHYYSVPYGLLGAKLSVRLTARTVEVLHKGARVACHPRSYEPHKYTTLKEHMPLAHQKYLEWTPSRMIQRAARIGPATAQFVEAILLSRRYPEHGYRSCLGIVRLEKHYPRERIEAAANRALTFNSLSYRSLKSILAKGLDRFTEEPPKTPSLFHENIRGDSYYH